jgi:hypothetical protein
VYLYMYISLLEVDVYLPMRGLAPAATASLISTQRLVGSGSLSLLWPEEMMPSESNDRVRRVNLLSLVAAELRELVASPDSTQQSSPTVRMKRTR